MHMDILSKVQNFTVPYVNTGLLAQFSSLSQSIQIKSLWFSTTVTFLSFSIIKNLWMIHSSSLKSMQHNSNYWDTPGERTDCEQVCGLDCLLFSSQVIYLYHQCVFYFQSLSESNKTATCMHFGWFLKKYQFPIICLLSSYDIVRTQCWGNGSHRATPLQPAGRGLHQPGPVPPPPAKVQHRLRRNLLATSTQSIRYLPGPRPGHAVSLWVEVRIRPGEGNQGQSELRGGLCVKWICSIKLWICHVW